MFTLFFMQYYSKLLLNRLNSHKLEKKTLKLYGNWTFQSGERECIEPKKHFRRSRSKRQYQLWKKNQEALTKHTCIGRYLCLMNNNYKTSVDHDLWGTYFSFGALCNTNVAWCEYAITKCERWEFHNYKWNADRWNYGCGAIHIKRLLHRRLQRWQRLFPIANKCLVVVSIYETWIIIWHQCSC